ncbi:hypothetical protein BDB01DRAFT_772382, partial [Pilobolus umbonatus]
MVIHLINSLLFDFIVTILIYSSSHFFSYLSPCIGGFIIHEVLWSSLRINQIVSTIFVSILFCFTCFLKKRI